jgi:D-alanine--poly(phosphoribitol) ligase subunit 1
MKLALLLDSLNDSAIHFPSNVAIVTDNASWDYRQLWARIVEFESALAGIALPACVPIAVTAHKTVDTLALMLALGKQGHTPLATPSTLGSMIKPTMFAAAGIYCELVAESDSGRPIVSLVISGKLQTNAVPSIYPADTCPLMMTTSGSTGIPKVVELSASGVNAFFSWGSEYFQLARESRVLSYAPLNFDLSLLEIWAPLAKGATIILVDTARATQTEYLKALIRDSRPDIIQGVPMLYSLLCPISNACDWAINGVRHIVFTGDTTPRKLRERVANLFPQAIFHNVYGCTETNDSFVHSADALTITRNERLPLGRPINGVIYRIVTDEGIDLDGAGEGELHTSTPFLTHGYTDPKLTAKAFYTESNNFRVYYRTGDRVARDESGQLTLIGRNDFIVKVRGVRTNPLDIELVLTQMASVKNAVVIPVNDEISGVVLHAVIEPTQGQTPDGLTMRMFCAQRLPHTSIPRGFHLHENPLPITSTGKPDRKTIALSIQP